MALLVHLILGTLGTLYNIMSQYFGTIFRYFLCVLTPPLPPHPPAHTLLRGRYAYFIALVSLTSPLL